MKYYYNDGSDVRGPFEKSELIDKNITEETMVWVEGMASWLPAGQVPMFSDILDGTFAANLKSTSQSSDQSNQEGTESESLRNDGEQSSSNLNNNMQNNPNYNQQGGYGQQGYGQQNPYQNQQGYGQQYPQQQYQQQQYPQQGNPDYEMYRPSTFAGWTVTGTVLGGIGILFTLLPFVLPALPYIASLVLGIVGLNKGNKVNKLWNFGNYQAAQEASASAKKLGMISVFLFIGFVVLDIIIIAFIGASFFAGPLAFLSAAR